MFRELTVAENLELGLWGRRDEAIAGDLESVYGTFPVLRERARQQAETLSGGEQQMLALGGDAAPAAPPDARRALAGPRAPDRPGGVRGAPGDQPPRHHDLLVEQNARLALRVAHQAAILEAGRVVLQGTPKELEEHEDVREAYLGLGGRRGRLPRGWRLYRKRRRW